MERTPEVEKFIEDHQELFWYSPAPKSKTVTDELLVETMLNYGQLSDIQELFNLVGKKNVAKIFYDNIKKSDRRRNNYSQLTANYFTLFFNRYAR